MARHFDIAVVGGGLAGATAALAAASTGYITAFAAPRHKVADGRTTALMMPSLALLENLGIWPAVRDTAAPLRRMRIIDGTSRLIRAPTVTFHASELEIEAFGYNIPNAPLLDALFDAISASGNVTHFDLPAEAIVENSEDVKLSLAGGTDISAELLVGADGRNSLVRAACGIGVRDWRYPQTAIVLNFSHEFEHADTSNEFHTENGPFTQVPLPGRRSSLVWAHNPADADKMRALSSGQLALAIEERMHSMLGKIVVEGKVHSFPFSGMMARAFGKGRMVLVGEAGHVFPPIGAQGLNLGLRDVLELFDALDQAGGPANAPETVRRYDRHRRSDVVSRTASVDMLNRTLLNAFLPVQMARSAGLAALASFAPLRNFAMREGMKPGGGFEMFKER
ncbi:MAG: UbiH/UbiF family hydroxylase [Hyphomicrobiales bacterium]|nr:UbiH/UbiF family hydroxylase [Hyphomicrobiales bacterium]MCP5001753.1 UbiH/UbiF family hydroxylase [Hyphomicrobiales bacterium]